MTGPLSTHSMIILQCSRRHLYCARPLKRGTKPYQIEQSTKRRFDDEMPMPTLEFVVTAVKGLRLQSVAPNENGAKKAWRELLESLRNRGIEQVQLFIADGFIGLENVIAEIYPTAKFQRCLVHVLRNSSHRSEKKGKISNSFRRDLMSDI